MKVVDGDTGRRIPGALVWIRERSARAGRDGVAALVPGNARRAHARAPGYMPAFARLSSPPERKIEVELYRRAAQWPFYGANLARTQVHPGIRLRPPYRVVWRRFLGSLLEFPGVVWEGAAYVNTYSGWLYALSMDDGSIVWKRRVGTLMASSPGVDAAGGQLVVTSMRPGWVSVVAMRNGRVRWRYRTGIAEASPAIRDGIAYLAAENGRVYALDLRRRRARWVRSTGSKVTASPAIAGRRLFIGNYGGHAYAFDTRTGRRLWTTSVGTRVYGTPAVANGRVYVPSVFSGLWALRASNGRVLWRLPLGEAHGAPAVYRGRVYFGTKAGGFYCVSARNGRVLWTRNLGGNVASAPQIIAGVVYASATTTRIFALDWRSGRRLWSFPYSQYAPVSGNAGRLLLHGYARVWAVEPKRKK